MDKSISAYYAEVCPDCDGWDLKFSNEVEKGEKLQFTATCRECGAEWEDYIDVEY